MIFILIVGSCSRFVFECEDGSGCVPWPDQCDQVDDCADGSDEENCGEFVVAKRLHLFCRLCLLRTVKQAWGGFHKEIKPKNTKPVSGQEEQVTSLDTSTKSSCHKECPTVKNHPSHCKKKI